MKTLVLISLLALPHSVFSKGINSDKTVLFKRPFHQKGIASWYGKENKKSSTGKKLTHKTPALAHRTLPIGTLVKVTSTKTNKCTFAVVEDRGPYIKNRIVDLNYPAAKELGILDKGITEVRVEIVD